MFAVRRDVPAFQPGAVAFRGSLPQFLLKNRSRNNLYKRDKRDKRDKREVEKECGKPSENRGARYSFRLG
jgi:hypothetical protein